MQRIITSQTHAKSEDMQVCSLSLFLLNFVIIQTFY